MSIDIYKRSKGNGREGEKERETLLEMPGKSSERR